MKIVCITPKGFKITRSYENGRDVYRVYCNLDPSRIWNKFNTERAAKAYVRMMEKAMEDDIDEIDSKVRIG